MTYDEWFIQQGNLHANVMKKLEDKSVDEVIEYFKFENMVKKTMKNIVQSAIGTKDTYRQFVLNNFKNIIDFSTVQDLVAMERLVGKGKLKGGKKIFTVVVRRLTKQSDIQKYIDLGKLPAEAKDKSAEGVPLYEKRMPTEEELQAFFFGTNMQEVLGYELGASTLGTRKDGLSRMIVTELAQDATMETLQEPAIMQEILSLNPELYSEIIVQDIATKINRSPSLKFSKNTKKQITSGTFILATKGVNSNSFKAWVANSEDEAIYQVLNKFFNKRFYDYRSVRKLVGRKKIKEIRDRFPTVNGKQIDGATDDVLPMGSIKGKFEAFDWTVIEIEKGNDIEAILKGMATAKAATGKGKPVCVLLKTMMGNGVDFMMHTHAWHGKAPNDAQLESALNQNPETLGDY